MSTSIDANIISGFRQSLDEHPVYNAVQTLDDLRCFMEHHVYSVWDFMSLIKFLQAEVAPSHWPWVPRGDGSVRRFINELVLEEESDSTHEGEVFSSRFELYLRAMEEIGADTTVIRGFVERVAQEGIDAALASTEIPAPSRQFSSTTFGFLGAHSPHQVAAALALGREHIIPSMFRAILGRIGVSESDAPIFHFYLNRHIHLDEDFHAPLSLRLLNELCAGETQAAEAAVSARIQFWDGVAEAIDSRRRARAA